MLYSNAPPRLTFCAGITVGTVIIGVVVGITVLAGRVFSWSSLGMADLWSAEGAEGSRKQLALPTLVITELGTLVIGALGGEGHLTVCTGAGEDVDAGMCCCNPLRFLIGGIMTGTRLERSSIMHELVRGCFLSVSVFPSQSNCKRKVRN